MNDSMTVCPTLTRKMFVKKTHLLSKGVDIPPFITKEIKTRRGTMYVQILSESIVTECRNYTPLVHSLEKNKKAIVMTTGG